MADLLQRAVKFGLSGGISTGVAYLSFVVLLPVMHYIPAATISWSLSVGCGFLLNRRFTFGITGFAGRRQDFGLFVFGAALQYALAMIGYVVLIGRLHLSPTPAFVLNLALTTSFSFVFHSLVTFRRAPLQ